MLYIIAAFLADLAVIAYRAVAFVPPVPRRELRFRLALAGCLHAGRALDQHDLRPVGFGRAERLGRPTPGRVGRMNTLGDLPAVLTLDDGDVDLRYV